MRHRVTRGAAGDREPLLAGRGVTDHELPVAADRGELTAGAERRTGGGASVCPEHPGGAVSAEPLQQVPLPSPAGPGALPQQRAGPGDVHFRQRQLVGRERDQAEVQLHLQPVDDLGLPDRGGGGAGRDHDGQADAGGGQAGHDWVTPDPPPEPQGACGTPGVLRGPPVQKPPQIFREVCGPLVTPPRLLGQRLQTDQLQVTGDGRINVSRGDGLLALGLVRQGHP
jgi:hypothetical protein